MSKFRPGYFDYIKRDKVYYKPIVENIFDLIYRSQFEAVKSQVTKGVVNNDTPRSRATESIINFVCAPR